ncbi:RHS repeat-associated core domain-containing protein [Bradyrhizobium sp. AZCC 1578]|uniref:RHS repeat-associated core domain-containing protein n=1 Tax=Bradyrhizobium sp. AZCC 1578 TaxID=3117027 RepID=UPI002FEE68FF
MAAANNGGNEVPCTIRPIDLMTGSKLFRVVDFATADGSLSLERVYNSMSYGNNFAASARAPWGIGQGWRFSFQHELHFDSSSPYVELETAEGSSLRFTGSTSGTFTASQHGYSLPTQTDYTLEFVGAYPSTWANVLAASTQWRVRDSKDRVWTFQTYLYPASGKYVIALPTAVTFRNGLQWSLAYGTNHELISITDSYGKSITFTWYMQDTAALGGSRAPEPIGIKSATLPDGTTLQYVADSLNSIININDRLVSVEHRDGSNTLLDSTTYLHENADFPYHVTGVKDSSDTRRWTVEYDNRGRAITSKGPNDADKVAVAYGTIASSALTRTVTNALGKQTTYKFNWFGGNVSLARIDGAASANCPASTDRTYTLATTTKFIASSTDAEGRVTNYTRNSRGLPTQIIGGYGTASARTTAITWHSTLNVPTQVVEPKLTTDYTWTSGQLTQVTQTDTTSQTVPYSTNGQTRTWAYTYDTYGSLLTVDGPLSGIGDTVTYTYDTSGYLASVTNEVGQTTTISAVDGRGLPTTIVDANGVTTNLTYDSERRLKTTTVDPSGLSAVTTIDYNVVGDITKITRPNGAYLQYTYDDARRITKVEDNSGAYAEYDRDNLGNATARRIKDSGGMLQLSQTAVFDELGRLLKFVGASSQTWTHAYDKTSNRVSVTDPRSNVFGWTFDSVNRLISTTDEDSNTVTLTRNGRDEITNYTDPRSLSTGYVRNGFGDVIQRASPDSGITVYSYNTLGNPVQITDARGVVTNLSYDNAGRLLTKQYPAAPAENVIYTWDGTGGGNKGKGRVTRIQDATGTVERIYNSLGQMVQEKKTTGAAVYTVGYGYDLDGNITGITYPSGRIVNYSRDAIGRISGVTSQTNAGTVTLADGVTWMPSGPLQSLRYGNGLTQIRTYTQDYLIAQMLVTDTSSGTDVVNRAHGRSDGVNITDIVDNIDAYRSESYLYTPSGRLENASGPWGVLGYAYDAVGNRTLEFLNNSGTVTEQVTNHETASNRPVEVTSNGTSVRTFSHDAAGNLVTDNRSGTAYTYRYNNRGRLDQLSIGSTVTADYSYDGLERMAIRTMQTASPPVTMHYIYDLAGHLIAEATAAGVVTREYVWLDDMPLAVAADLDTAAPNLWYVHADHLDRPIRMTDSAKSVVWNAFFMPFGAVDVILGPASNNLRFPGQYFLLESGLHYNWHRHYDPTIGRYTQGDPIRNVLATQRVDLDGTFLIASGGISGGSRLGLHFNSAGDYNGQIGSELPEFVDGPSLYAYARSAPTFKVDNQGLATSSSENNLSRKTNLTCGAYQVAAAGKSPTFWCQNVNCGAPHGGLFGPLCPSCNGRLRNGGPPILLENGQIIRGPIKPLE